MPYKDKKKLYEAQKRYRKRQLKWAYLAGLIDGEGTISLTKHGNRIHPELQMYISNTSAKLMDWLKENFGEIGTVYTTYVKQRRPLFCFRFSWRYAKRILDKTLPYLIIKKPQAQLALTFLANKDWTKGQRKELSPKIKKIWNQVSSLNHGGEYYPLLHTNRR